MNIRKSLIIVLLFASCHDARERNRIMHAMKDMSDLATVEYTVSKVIKANDDKTWYKIGDRKILMSCEAHLKAGIDLSAINKSSFTTKDKEIWVRLPAPKLISINLPPESINTEYEEIGFLRTKFSNQERDLLARQAEADIRKQVEALGILQQARSNTALFITGFLEKMGYETIHISFGGKPFIQEP